MTEQQVTALVIALFSVPFTLVFLYWISGGDMENL